MMTSYLPADLEEEILSRVPATSLMRWRSICRRWNTLFFEDQRFSEKHFRNAPKQPLVLMLTEYRLFFASVDLKFVPPSIEFSDALSLKNYYVSRDAHIDTVSHCDGLLLCATESELVVWNPCSGQTRWIRDHDGSRWFRGGSLFMLGYENNQSCRSYKILKFYHIINYDVDVQYERFKIYDFNSNMWRFLDARINPRNCISNESHGVTLNGNAYWISSHNEEGGDLLSFDFTRERFRRYRFPLTFRRCHYRALSVVREELSVLRWIDSNMEMWVTNNMDTCEADLSWTKSFTMDFVLNIYTSVLIDEDKKVALCDSPCEEVAFTIGEEDEYYSEVPFEGARSRHEHIFNYVPSLVQFPQQSIEPDGFGKWHHRRWWGHRVRRCNGGLDYDTRYSEETDDDMMSESDDEWDWREIECTDFSNSSRRGNRGRGWTKTRCATL
ncbi:hypothetical protein Bca4012_101678 [Brassica carinata]